MQRQDYRDRTITVALQNLSWVLRIYGLYPNNLDDELAERIKQDMKDRGLMATTIHQRLYALRYTAAAFNIKVNVKLPPRTKPLVEFLSPSEA